MGWTLLPARAVALGGLVAAGVFAVAGSPPEGLVLEGMAEPAPELASRLSRYARVPTALFQDWHPRRRDILLTGRHGDRVQLLEVSVPLGARRPLMEVTAGTVLGGWWRPGEGRDLVFLQDDAGDERSQLFHFNLESGRSEALTTSGTRNLDARWSPTGRWLGFISLRSGGPEVDFCQVQPGSPTGARRMATVAGGHWSLLDWSADEKEWLVISVISARESRLHRLDLATGRLRAVTPEGWPPASYGSGRYLPGGGGLLVSSDRSRDFLALARIDPETGHETPVGPGWDGEVEAFEIEPGGRRVAVIVNRDGISGVWMMDLERGRAREVTGLPSGVVTGLRWRPNGHEIAFSLSTVRFPNEVFSIDVRTLAVTRWTAGNPNGPPGRNRMEPETVRVRGFDGLAMSGILHRPDPRRFPGRRPLVVHLHGGPELQARPVYPMRWMYLLEERGFAVLEPNVRGSAGFGKGFLDLDNGRRREDAVRDVGSFLDAMEARADVDAGRMAVHGVSYGGYLALASLVHFGERLRCGVDVMGIASFPEFLRDTREDRRDLRRAEYGDERDPGMERFLREISPLAQADRIRRPLLVVHGGRDSRVPAAETQRLVAAIRARGGDVASLFAVHEGHGFADRRNADFLLLTTLDFLTRHLEPVGRPPGM